jgi:hypothetical protein
MTQVIESGNIQFALIQLYTALCQSPSFVLQIVGDALKTPDCIVILANVGIQSLKNASADKMIQPDLIRIKAAIREME